jgi:hypothetical protein
MDDNFAGLHSPPAACTGAPVSARGTAGSDGGLAPSRSRSGSRHPVGCQNLCIASDLGFYLDTRAPSSLYLLMIRFVRLADAARAERRLEGRRDIGIAARGRDPESSGRHPKSDRANRAIPGQDATPADLRRDPVNWSCGWPDRTRGGGTGASRVNSRVRATGSARGAEGSRVACRPLWPCGRCWWRSGSGSPCPSRS